jgi:hypothetical protein
MGIWLLTIRAPGALSLLLGVLPVVRELAQETMSRAREQYHAGRRSAALIPSVSRLNPDALSHFAPSVLPGRLTRLLVDARPMGP